MQQISQKIKNFKPEFGNMEHIRILEMITKVKKKRELVESLLVNDVAIKRNLKEIERIESNINFLIESSIKKNAL